MRHFIGGAALTALFFIVWDLWDNGADEFGVLSYVDIFIGGVAAWGLLP